MSNCAFGTVNDLLSSLSAPSPLSPLSYVTVVPRSPFRNAVVYVKSVFNIASFLFVSVAVSNS